MIKNKYEINQIINGKVISINKTYLLVGFGGNIGICHISNVSDYLVKNINDFFIVGNFYDFLIIDISKNSFKLSYKAIHPKNLKWHSNTIPTPKGFSNLKKDLERRLKTIS